jgi:hypothetical protein
MTLYSITAPNGVTYETEGPPNATPEQVKAVILRAHPEAGKPAVAQRGTEAPNALEKMGSLGSLAASAADIPLSAVAGLAGSSKTFTDLFGADNAASNVLGDISRLASEYKSAGSREDSKKAAQVQKEAEGKGVWEEVKAAAKAFTYAPVETTAGVLGSAVPYIGATLGAAALAPATGGASLAALYGTIGAAGAGAASGVGMIKGDIYDAMYSAALEKGVDEKRAKAAAEKAQEYGGPNTDQIALGGLFGAAAGATGLSRQALGVVARTAERKLLKTVAERTGRKSITKGIAMGALEEAVPEAAQAGQERFAQNVALGRAGYDVDPMAGVAGQAAFEGIASLIPGGFGGGKAAAAENLRGVPLPPSSEQTKAERELARQAKAAGIELDEESISATYNALIAKYVAEGMPLDQAYIQASRNLPNLIGVPADDLGGVPIEGAAKPAPTVRVADVTTPAATAAEPVRAPLQEVTPDKVAEVLPTIDTDFADNIDSFEIEYGVTELTPEIRNAAAELVASDPNIAPVDAIGSVLKSAQRAAPTVAPPTDITAPVAPTKPPSLKERTTIAQQLVADTVANDPILTGLGVTEKQQATAKNQLANGRQPDAATAIKAVLTKKQLAALTPAPIETAPVIEAPVIPAPPSVDQVATAPVTEAIKQAAAPTNNVIPSIAETAARDIGITEAPVAAPVEIAPTPVAPPVEIAPTPVAAPIEAAPIEAAPVAEPEAVPVPLAPEIAPEAAPIEAVVEEEEDVVPTTFDAAINSIEAAYRDENGDLRPEIAEEDYNRLIDAAENERSTPAKIYEALQKARDKFSENYMGQRYRPGAEGAGTAATDVQTAIASAAKGIGASPNVVQSFADLPAEARQQAEADGATDAAGITMPDGQVHLIADNLTDAADAVATLYHEVLGHVGLAKLFRTRLDARLTEMYRGNKKLRDDVDAFIAENPDAYPNDPDPLARAVEEILAQRSEAGKIEASLLAKIAGVIKDIGRRIGIRSDFSDAEVTAILSRAHDMAIAGTQEGKTGQRYARKKKTGPSDELLRAENMLARSRNPGNLNQATSTVMKVQRSTRRLNRLMRIIPGIITTKRGRFMLQFLTPMDVVRLATRKSKALGSRLDKVLLAMSEMRDTRSAMQAKVQDRAYRWNKFNARFKEGGRLLSDLMNLATLYNIDPRRADNVRDFIAQDDKIREIIADPKLGLRAQNNRIKARTELVEAVYKRWNALASPANGSSEGRKIFDMAAKAYREVFDRQLASTLVRINNSTLSPARKAAATKQVKAMFAEAEKIGLYFPLGREGDFWMRVGQGKDRFYTQFTSQIDRDLALRERHDEMVENGDKRSFDEVIYSGEMSSGDTANDLQKDAAENDSTRMLQGVLNELDAGNIPDLKAVKEQLTQMYLQTLPQSMQASAMQRRKNVSGFTANTLNTFVVTQNAAASRLARLEHGDNIRNNLAMAYALIQNDPEKDQLSPYVDQIAEFAGRQMAPTKGDPWAEFLATAANRATFLYMMTSLKTAIIQPLQLTTTGISVLTRDYGYRAPALAFRNMTSFYKLLGTSKLDEDGNVITKWGQPSMNDGSYINDEPNPEMRRVRKALWNGGKVRGIFSHNYTGDVTGDRQVDTGTYDNAVLESTRKTLSFVHNFMTGAGFHTERLSREVMFMSAAELEYTKLRKQGVSEADAIKRAEQRAAELTNEALFDYSADSKPMAARGPLGRVVFQFATFTMNMSSLLIRNFYNAVSLKSSLQERRDASILFFGTMATTYMWAGATGLPLYTTFMGLADVARELFRPLLEGDDEDPTMYNAESGNPMAYASMDLWFRQWFLPNMLGGGESQRAAEMGPISAATDKNVSASLSLNDMYFRDEQPAKNVADAVQNLIASAGLGASGSMVKQMAQGIDLMLEGKGDRAAEKLMPYSFLRQPLIAKRLEQEGYITPNGVELKPAEFYTVGKLLGQALGFGSTEVAEAQKRNILFSRATDKIDAERTKVQRRYGDTYLNYLAKPTPENLAALNGATANWDEYITENGAINPLTSKQMADSIIGRVEERETAKQLGGIQTDKRYRILAADMLDQGQ